MFNRETGQLEIRDENQLSPKHRKLLNKKLRTSPLVRERSGTSNDETDTGDRKTSVKAEMKKASLPGIKHVLNTFPHTTNLQQTTLKTMSLKY